MKLLRLTPFCFFLSKTRQKKMNTEICHDLLIYSSNYLAIPFKSTRIPYFTRIIAQTIPNQSNNSILEFLQNLIPQKIAKNCKKKKKNWKTLAILRNTSTHQPIQSTIDTRIYPRFIIVLTHFNPIPFKIEHP